MTSAEWLATGSAIAIACMAFFLMALRTKGRKPSKRQRQLLSKFSEKAPLPRSAPLGAVEKPTIASGFSRQRSLILTRVAIVPKESCPSLSAMRNSSPDTAT